MEHNEFVVEFKDGSREWVDPVYLVENTDLKLNVHGAHREYCYEKSEISKWVVRPHSRETTNNTILKGNYYEQD